MVILTCVSFSSPQVMEETDTQIAWPSKLKIGAKSKKGKTWCPSFETCSSEDFVCLISLLWGLSVTPSLGMFTCTIHVYYIVTIGNKRLSQLPFHANF